MNVRFADGSIRFRITSDEFQRLLGGKALTLEVPLGGSRSLRASVSAIRIGAWQLDSDPTGLWLRVPHAELEVLAGHLPSRSGVEHVFHTHGGEVQVAVEVDVKTRNTA